MIWTVITFIGVFCVLAVLAGAVWTLRRQNRFYPPGTRVGDDEERERGSRWIGWIHGGGHG